MSPCPAPGSIEARAIPHFQAKLRLFGLFRISSSARRTSTSAPLPQTRHRDRVHPRSERHDGVATVQDDAAMHPFPRELGEPA
jgi:hypothetical protein